MTDKSQQTRFTPKVEAAFDRHTRRQNAGFIMIFIVPMLVILVTAILFNLEFTLAGGITLATIPLWILEGVDLL